MINESVKKATDSIIDSIICKSDIGVATDIVLANAVYFKGVWQHSFHTHGTWPGMFHCLDGSHAEVSFMTAFGTMHVACLDGFKVLKLPYKPWRTVMFEESLSYQRSYSMLVFLPDACDGITAMVDVVTAAPASLQGILDQMTERTVRVKLPKFEISFKWDDLEGDLCRLGLSLPFSQEEADLRGMCVGDAVASNGDMQQCQPIFLSKFAHMVVVKVAEKGTEGGEHQSYLRGRPEVNPDFVEFIADHPFTFLIKEECSGVIVFAGHVLDPTKLHPCICYSAKCGGCCLFGVSVTSDLANRCFAPLCVTAIIWCDFIRTCDDCLSHMAFWKQH